MHPGVSRTPENQWVRDLSTMLHGGGGRMKKGPGAPDAEPHKLPSSL